MLIYCQFCRIGLFGQLQQVVQSEKESDMEFLKNIENGANQSNKALQLLYFYFISSIEYLDTTRNFVYVGLYF